MTAPMTTEELRDKVEEFSYWTLPYAVKQLHTDLLAALDSAESARDVWRSAFHELWKDIDA
jgi:hypothetical protein